MSRPAAPSAGGASSAAAGVPSPSGRVTPGMPAILGAVPQAKLSCLVEARLIRYDACAAGDELTPAGRKAAAR